MIPSFTSKNRPDFPACYYHNTVFEPESLTPGPLFEPGSLTLGSFKVNHEV
jgi:hypothetical protein